MVKIKLANGEETKWDKDSLKKELESAGLSKKIAEVITDQVSHKMVDGWTVSQVSEEAAVELKRLKEDVERAYNRYLDSAGINRGASSGKQMSEVSPETSSEETETE